MSVEKKNRVLERATWWDIRMLLKKYGVVAGYIERVELGAWTGWTVEWKRGDISFAKSQVWGLLQLGEDMLWISEGKSGKT